MKTFGKCMGALAMLSMMIGLNRDPVIRSAFAQDEPSIESVMEDMNNDDLFFGGKDEIKRENIRKTKETNQEEILIQNSPELQQLLGLRSKSTTSTTTGTSCQIGGGTTCTTASFSMNSSVSSGSVSFTLGGLVIESSVANSAVTNSVTIAQGTSQTLAIKCNSPLSCTATFTVLSGASCPAISSVVISSGGTSTFTCTAS